MEAVASACAEGNECQFLAQVTELQALVNALQELVAQLSEREELVPKRLYLPARRETNASFW